MKDIFQEKGDTMHLLRHNKIVKYHILTGTVMGGGVEELHYQAPIGSGT